MKDVPVEDPEVLEWWSLTPAQRFAESAKLWSTFLALGGSLDPEPDSQSPFHFVETSGTGLVDARQACILYGAAEFTAADAVHSRDWPRWERFIVETVLQYLDFKPLPDRALSVVRQKYSREG